MTFHVRGFLNPAGDHQLLPPTQQLCSACTHPLVGSCPPPRSQPDALRPPGSAQPGPAKEPRGLQLRYPTRRFFHLLSEAKERACCQGQRLLSISWQTLHAYLQGERRMKGSLTGFNCFLGFFFFFNRNGFSLVCAGLSPKGCASCLFVGSKEVCRQGPFVLFALANARAFEV